MRKLVIAMAVSMSVLLFPCFTRVSQGYDLYLGAGVGNTDYDYVEGDGATGFEATAEMKFNPNLAVSLSYIDLGEESYSYNSGHGKETESASGIAVSVLGFIPASEQVSFYGRIGLFSWDVEYKDVADGFVYGEGSDSGTDPFFGIGLNIGIAERFAIRAEFDQFTFGTDYYDEEATRFTVAAFVKL